MNLDQLSTGTGEWLSNQGPDSDVVISSRIRLARNVAGYPFLSTTGDTERMELYRTLEEAVSDLIRDDEAFVVDVDDADEIDRQLMVERHLISRQHATGDGSRGVAIWNDERRAIMMNEEDHLRIQVLRSGLQLEHLWNDIDEFDNRLSKVLDFAYDQQLGFLTACPTNVGTGIRVSVMVHLPALKLTQELDRVIRAARDMRLAVRGMFGEGTDAAGDLYQISNQTTLGKSEAEVIEQFDQDIIPKVVDYERAARGSLTKRHLHQLDDRIFRAYGILANARTIGTEESLALLSHLRMGVHTERFNGIDFQTLSDLFLHVQPAHLQKTASRPLDGAARSIARSALLRERLS